MLAGPVDQLHPPISALRIRDSLKSRFNPLNKLTTENREKEWTLIPALRSPLSDYVDDFLLCTAMYESSLDALSTNEAKKRRLLE